MSVFKGGKSYTSHKHIDHMILSLSIIYWFKIIQPIEDQLYWLENRGSEARGSFWSSEKLAILCALVEQSKINSIKTSTRTCHWPQRGEGQSKTDWLSWIYHHFQENNSYAFMIVVNGIILAQFNIHLGHL